MSYISSIAELSEAEGVFTTAQAERLGIPRDALHDAVESGRLARVMRGAYRLVGSGFTEYDELAAIWKLTAPSKFSHERAGAAGWDGVVVGGTSAAYLLGIGDFYLSPYRIYTARRFNTRNSKASFTVRRVVYDDIVWRHGLPVTKAERSVFDLALDKEDPSLTADVLRDASRQSGGFDFMRLASLFTSEYGVSKGGAILDRLMADAGLSSQGA